MHPIFIKLSTINVIKNVGLSLSYMHKPTQTHTYFSKMCWPFSPAWGEFALWADFRCDHAPGNIVYKVRLSSRNIVMNHLHTPQPYPPYPLTPHSPSPKQYPFRALTPPGWWDSFWSFVRITKCIIPVAPLDIHCC